MDIERNKWPTQQLAIKAKVKQISWGMHFKKLEMYLKMKN